MKEVKGEKNNEESYIGDYGALRDELFNNMKECAIIYISKNDGDDFILLDINRSAEKIENIKGDYLKGKNIKEIFPQVEESRLFEKLQKVSKTGYSESLSIKECKDGQIAVWKQHNIFKVPESGILIDIYEDVTNKKQLKQSLNTSWQSYRMLLENIPMCYQSVDSNSIILDVNLTWLNTFGYTSEEVSGQWFGDFIVPECIDIYKKSFSVLKEIGEIKNVEFEMKRKDGKKVSVSMTGKANYNKDGSFKQAHAIIENITERKQMLNDIIKVSKFAEEDPYPVMRVDNNYILTYANAGSKLLLNHWDLKTGEKIPNELNEKIDIALNTDKTTHTEITCDGTIYSLIFAPIQEGKYVNIYGRDITSRKKVENNLNKVNRMYAFLSQINQTIIRTTSKEELFDTICKVAIEYGKFRFAWIGLVDYSTERVIPYKHAGIEEGYLQNLFISINDDLPEGRGITGRAIREKKCIVSNNISDDPFMLPWRADASKRGYISAATVPFYLNGKVYGILSFDADEKDFFDTDETKLLEEISLDISYALKQIKLNDENINITKQLAKSEELQRTLLNEIPVSIITCDTNGNVIFANKRIMEIFKTNTINSMKPTNLLTDPAYSSFGLPPLITQCLQTGSKIITDKEYINDWGKRTYYSCYVLPLKNESNAITGTLIMALDMTERKKTELALKESEERFRVITEVSPYPVSIFDSDNNYQYINPKFTQVFGYSLDEISTREKWLELSYPDTDYRNQVREDWDKMIQSKQMEEPKLFNVTCRNGDVRSVLFHFYALDKDKNLIIYFDITDVPWQIAVHQQIS